MAQLGSMARSTYGQLQAAFAQAHNFEHAISMLRWDAMTKMPPGAGAVRSSVLAELEAALHAGLRDPNIPRLIAQARVEIHQQQNAAREAGNKPSNVGDLLASLREMERTARQATAIDPALVKRKAEITGEAERTWRVAKGANDWKSFQPHLEKVVQVTIEEGKQLAAAAAKSTTPTQFTTYDALLDKYEPGVKSEHVSPLFDSLLEWLPAAARFAAERDAKSMKDSPTFEGEYPFEKQRALSKELMAVFGFDMNRGRLDEAAHPFCGGVPQDVRLTTRFNLKQPMDGFLAVIHETGHGRYEQNLPTKHAALPVGKARSMGIHESQSLFCEMQIARGDPFLRWLSPKLTATFGPQAVFEPTALARQVRQVRLGKIRVYADELTYPLHVALRYNIERRLINQSLKVADLPAVWRESMRELLNVELRADEHGDGCMQDIHWAMGAFGYFPTYTLGAAYAAQFMRAVRSELGSDSVDEAIENGNHVAVVNWLRTKVWSRGSELPTPALVMSATGEPLNPQYYREHLFKNYLTQRTS